MELIIGGHYQGKLDYVKSHYQFTDSDIFSVEEKLPVESVKCIYGFEKFVLYCLRHDLDALVEFQKSELLFENTIIVCEDISSGVIPLEKENRLWRDEVGRVLNTISRKSNSVTRMFCGIPQKLK